MLILSIDQFIKVICTIAAIITIPVTLYDANKQGLDDMTVLHLVKLYVIDFIEVAILIAILMLVCVGVGFISFPEGVML